MSPTFILTHGKWRLCLWGLLLIILLPASTESHLYIGYLVLFIIPVKTVTAADFLYSILPFEESNPVVEFEPPPLNKQYNALGEGMALRPGFLYSTDLGHRVVLYYLPWCPHCQAYVPMYIALARRVNEMARGEANLHMVKFYAVSCLPNKQVCKDQHVGGVPGIKIYPAGSVTGIPADPMKLHPFHLMRILGLPWGSIEEDWDMGDRKAASGGHVFLKGNQNDKAKPITSKRRKQDVFQDAFRSFHFSMATEVYMANGPLSEQARKVLGDWLLLLQNTLPPAWRIQALLQELIANFEAISKDEKNLLDILAKFPPKSEEWSTSCSHGKEGNGYTCGLWQLFHIVTVGVVQFNENAVANNEQISYHTAKVAQTLRDVIENFFACNACRREFLKAFDSCAHDRCHRLVDTAGESEQWIELPLWLWAEHNSVNIRLTQEHTNGQATEQNTNDAQWPSRRECPNCWGIYGSPFDRNNVYHYLLEEYWPGFVRKEAKRRDYFGSALAPLVSSSDDEILVIPYALLLLPLLGPTSILVMWCRTRQRKSRSGRHKKLDL